jgi:integrase
MAMTLRSQDVAEDMISQILGHADLKTTKVYLDSFDAEAIAEATKNL